MPSFFVTAIIIVGIVAALSAIIWFFTRNNNKAFPAPPIAQTYLQQTQLMAYERLVLFVERNYPPHLIDDLYNKQMQVEELRALMVARIKEEWKHNITQQIYVSIKMWESLRNFQENMLMILHLVTDMALAEGMDTKSYAQKVVAFFTEEAQQTAYKSLLNALKMEVRLFILSPSLSNQQSF